MSRPGRPRTPGHDAAILAAAIELFVESGAAGTSIEAIARRAGVTKPTLYRRWPTKEALLSAALEHARSDDLDRLTAESSLDDVISHTAMLLGRPSFRALIMRLIGAALDYPELVEDYTRRHLRPRLELLHVIIEREIIAGTLPADLPPQVVEDALLGVLGIVLLHPGLTAPEIASRLQAVLTHLTARPA